MKKLILSGNRLPNGIAWRRIVFGVAFLGVALASLSMPASAATSLGTYQFTSNAVTATSPATGLSFGNFGRGAGATAVSNSSAFDSSNFAGASLSAAITANAYIDFTITPTAGYSYSLTSFGDDYSKDSGGSPVADLLSSQGGFDTSHVVSALTTGTGQTATLTGFTNLTSATEFRIYIFAASNSSKTFTFDNVLLNGSTQALASLSTSISSSPNSRVMLNAANVQYGIQVTNDSLTAGTAATQGLDYALNLSGASGFSLGSPSSGTGLAGSSSVTDFVNVDTSSTGVKSSGTFTVSSDNAWRANGTAGASSTPLSLASITVVANRLVTAPTIHFGRVLVNAPVSGASNVSLSSAGSDSANTRIKVADGGSDSNGLGFSISGGNPTYVWDGGSGNANGYTGGLQGISSDTRSLSGGTFTTAGFLTGSVTLTNSGAEGGAPANTTLAGQTVGSTAVNYDATPVNQRTFSTPAAINLGRFLVNTATTGSASFSSTGAQSVTANATINGFTVSGADVGTLALNLSSGVGTNIFNGPDGISHAASYSVAGTVGTAGAISGTFSAPVTAELGSISNLTVGVSGTAVNQRAFSTPAAINLGRFLVNSVPTGSASFSSTGAQGVTANATIDSFTASGTDVGTLALNLSSGVGTNIFNGPDGISHAASYSVAGTVGTAGAISGTFSAPVTAELGSISNLTVGVSGTAVNQRAFSTPAAINLGRFLVNSVPTGSASFSSTGAQGVTANATINSFTASGTDVGTLALNLSSAVGTNNFNGPDGNTYSASYSVGGTVGSAGAINGAFSAPVTAELGSISNLSVGVSGNALVTRSISGAVGDLGRVLSGTNLDTLSKLATFTSSGLHSDTTDVKVDGTLTFNGSNNSQQKTVTGQNAPVASSGTFYSAPVATLETGLNDTYNAVAVAYTATVLTQRAVSGDVGYLGRFLSGTNLNTISASATFTSSGSHNNTTDVLVDGTLNFNGANNSQQKTLTGQNAAIATAGTFYTAPVATQENGLGDIYANVNVTYTADVVGQRLVTGSVGYLGRRLNTTNLNTINAPATFSSAGSHSDTTDVTVDGTLLFDGANNSQLKSLTGQNATIGAGGVFYSAPVVSAESPSIGDSYAPVAVSYTATPLALRSVSGTVGDLGRVMNTTNLNTLARQATFTSSGANGDTTSVLVDGTLLFDGSSNSQLKSIVGQTATVAASGAFYSAPVMTQESGLGDIYPNVAVSYSATPLADRPVSSPPTVDLGKFLLNSGSHSVGASNLYVTSSSGDHDSYANAQLSSPTGAVNGISISGSGTLDGSTTQVGFALSGTIDASTPGITTGSLPLINAGEAGVLGTQSPSSASVSYSFSVGAAKAAATPGPNLNSFVATEALSSQVVHGADYTNLSSYVAPSAISGYMIYKNYTDTSDNPADWHNTEAKFLGGVSTSTDGNTVSMNWRSRSAAETPGGSTSPLIKSAPIGGLLSDVVQLTGMELPIQPPLSAHPNTPSAKQTDPFVLQMTYDPSAIPAKFGSEAVAAANGFIYLGWLNSDFDGDPNATTSDRWTYAVRGNFYAELNGLFPDVEHFSAQTGFVGSYADYFAGATSLATSSGLKDLGANSFQLGDWGVDPQQHTVWAVVNHNSEFAVVPEPSTAVLALLGLAACGLWGRQRRATSRSTSPTKPAETQS